MLLALVAAVWYVGLLVSFVRIDDRIKHMHDVPLGMLTCILWPYHLATRLLDPVIARLALPESTDGGPGSAP